MASADPTGPKGGLYGSAFLDTSSLDPNVRATMMGYYWATQYGGTQATTVFTYAFATSDADFDIPGGYPEADYVDIASELSAVQKDAVRLAVAQLSAFTQLSFVESASATAANATLRFANYQDEGSESNFPPNAGSYAPSDSRLAGDTWLGLNGDTTGNYIGTDEYLTIIHEMGHAFGLKHGHDSDYNGGLSADRNGTEFSVMTYASYIGTDLSQGLSTAWRGSAPQGYMMYDIAALQAYYGANFSAVGTTAVYSWDAVTGQQYINGEAAPLTGVSETGKILQTIWTQGATATYDFSNFSEDQLADLRPGQWSTFSRAQLGDLNNAVPQGTLEYQAKGNVYNALLYEGDTRSAVSGLITGSGNDTLIGNDIDNLLIANAGDDHITTGAGNNRVSGGAGADTIVFGSGHNILFDALADLNGDAVFGFSALGRVDMLGSRLTAATYSLTHDAATATFASGGSAFQLFGDFSGGDFMTVARGSGAEAITYLSFGTFLPTLSEGAAVDASLINGIANQPYLSGDGGVSFTLEFTSAQSGYRNMLGTYNISVDGSISDVRILFGDTSVEAGGTTLSLGQPGNGDSVGFFLIQDGFNRYGSLPDDISFLFEAGSTTPVLHSQQLALYGATVFHSTAAYNADGLDHVLSGISSDASSLVIGFEDVARGTADDDFQDVVFTLHAHDGFLLV
ncbi:hypothetical protein GCM10007301_10070 [Azorhizobium oxalatiphilum]|uniref:Peptidase metallopeptidase domain-containing protein n=1 Tax=Azorhizobium oxalatiphilum TaxID=980631 RepID=A0A917BSA4_9HYPH|nr:DUF4114 domain-containing protein [Azorhizobium oxalatiphilum]GGF52576.1 hypothetical protein GCM10007301_10070 [Azorhizobium oxalatiphilum]